MLPSLGFCSNLVIRVTAGGAQEMGALAFPGVSGSDSGRLGGGGGTARAGHPPPPSPRRLWGVLVETKCGFRAPAFSSHTEASNRALTSAAFPEKFCGVRTCARACAPAGVRARGGHRCMAREVPLPSASLRPTLSGPPRGTGGPGGRSW